MKVKLKAKTQEALDRTIYLFIADGWVVIKPPSKKLFGCWTARMKLKETKK